MKLSCRPTPGYIYAIQTVSGPIKIGRAKDVKDRLGILQTGSFETLTLIASSWVENDGEMERWLHYWLKKRRIKGEWFTPAKEVLEVVEVMKQGKLMEFYTPRVAADIVRDYQDPDYHWFHRNPLLFVLRKVEQLAASMERKAIGSA